MKEKVRYFIKCCNSAPSVGEWDDDLRFLSVPILLTLGNQVRMPKLPRMAGAGL